MSINLRKLTSRDILLFMENTLPKLLKKQAESYPDVPAQYARSEDGEFTPVLFKEYYQTVLDLGAGLLSVGNGRGDHIGLIADNRKEWAHSSMAIMTIGAADVPRGCDAMVKELVYILSFPECKTVFVENEVQLMKILDNKTDLPLVRTVVIFDKPGDDAVKRAKDSSVTLLTYQDMLAHGRTYRAEFPERIETELEKGTSSELATIIFTSGTTGEPKGVMLSHDNFLCQLEELPSRIPLDPGDRALCILPVWHSFERLCEYMILNGASAIVYSKPVGSVLLADLTKMNPQLMPSVPRIWESVYDGIYRSMRKTGGVKYALFTFFVAVSKLTCSLQRRLTGQQPRFSTITRLFDIVFCFIPWLILLPWKLLGGVLVFSKIKVKLGNSFRCGVSGGGALPPNIDEFFWAVGIKVLEGYGLTETAPVVAVRPHGKPVFGTIGKPISCCEVKIVDENGKELPPGVKGTVLIRGRNVMKGYFKKPDLTAAVLSADGWLDTGDLGFKTVSGEIILRGRKKDTIVLRGGENIEPAPIEMKINESRYIQQSVVVGQDQRYLGALIIPNQDEVTAWAQNNGVSFTSWAGLLGTDEVRKLIEGEISELISQKTGFKIFERISRIALLEKPFQSGVELSAKQEIMRYKLDVLYKKEISGLFH